MKLNWLPWKLIVKYAARSHGFLDPIALMAHMQRFVQPSEVNEPIELLRAGAVLHARGLINSRVIQHNLDWVWPFWVESQFNPHDNAFIPRAFSITHINLSHRNWCAVGLPNYPNLPIVDPRGLVTPFYDGWSLDSWLFNEEGDYIIPSKLQAVDQQLVFNNNISVVTNCDLANARLYQSTSVENHSGRPTCKISITAESHSPAWLVLSLRPYNPEGISFVHRLALSADRNAWSIDRKYSVTFDQPADRHQVSDYRRGDVYIHLQDERDHLSGKCDIGMLTAAALFKIPASETKAVNVEIPLAIEAPYKNDTKNKGNIQKETWSTSLAHACQLDLPDKHFQFLYDAALRTLVLHSVDDVYPGPYTYKRFWFRDAAFIIHALLCSGFFERAEQALKKFPSRQTGSGYFHSQEGEWDANGEALWIIDRFCQLTNTPPPNLWRDMITKGADWIIGKRLPLDKDDLHGGLLPAGFSAEHLGPNDYYYWDDFWGIAGLRSAAHLCEKFGDKKAQKYYRKQAEDFQMCVDENLQRIETKLKRPAMPASPNRRLDAGAVGSIALGYPTQLCSPTDRRLLDTVRFLLDNCFFEHGFFQDMTHSGINAYLTLQIAQILMRAGDSHFSTLMSHVAELASPTGQWPEAIHPHTKGGCMGDGQHVWAAAEWVLMIRACFIREENEKLVVGAGIIEPWLRSGQAIKFGPAPTTYGMLSIELQGKDQGDHLECQCRIDAQWHSTPPRIEIALPGFKSNHLQDNDTHVNFIVEPIT